MESEESDIYIAVAFILVILVGAVGNFITLVVLKKDNNFIAMNNARLPIGNLAVVDLFLSVIRIVYAVGIIDKKRTAHPIVCSSSYINNPYDAILVCFSCASLLENA